MASSSRSSSAVASETGDLISSGVVGMKPSSLAICFLEVEAGGIRPVLSPSDNWAGSNEVLGVGKVSTVAGGETTSALNIGVADGAGGTEVGLEGDSNTEKSTAAHGSDDEGGDTML